MMRRMRMLVVWSYVSRREGVCEFLTEKGYDVVQVLDVEMLDLMCDLHRPDLIMTSLYLQDVHHNVYTYLMEHTIPVILLTHRVNQLAYFKDGTLACCHPMRNLILPFTVSELLEAIDDLLHEKCEDIRWMNRIYGDREEESCGN